MSDERQRMNERRLERLEKNDEKIFNSLEDIKNGQHTQELVNQKMTYTLDKINEDRDHEKKVKKERERKYEEEKNNRKKDFKQIKFMVFGTVLTIIGSILWALIRMVFGFE
ncbi:DUF2951 family protein [Staphylococcus massiliensis]|uniref:Uncharacterized protein n=1 Tax=Staphylococcus massiliensis S46 TaxID=1229783 RepID=K9ASL6_9STAP|nr:DUF2951 family protein [Staphylococcus massiliensis]EKU50309.1 hypothetical protein C273_01665 [Staphylococcus massiliensis S46]